MRIDTPVDLGLSDWLEGVGLPLVDPIEKTSNTRALMSMRFVMVSRMGG